MESKRFGERLRECRGALSQEAVAKRLRKARQGNLSSYENRVHPPPAATVVRLAEAIGCDPAELLRDVETNYDRIRRGKDIVKESARFKPEKIRKSRAPTGRRTVAKKRAG
jgi:transcriptional regulator with XRE-family HTH domain